VRIGAPLPPPTSNDRANLEKTTQDCATLINELHSLGR
jgi:hypothetical protein